MSPFIQLHQPDFRAFVLVDGWLLWRVCEWVGGRERERERERERK